MNIDPYKLIKLEEDSDESKNVIRILDDDDEENRIKTLKQQSLNVNPTAPANTTPTANGTKRFEDEDEQEQEAMRKWIEGKNNPQQDIITPQKSEAETHKHPNKLKIPYLPL